MNSTPHSSKDIKEKVSPPTVWVHKLFGKELILFFKV